jgi:hypothetical protein
MWSDDRQGSRSKEFHSRGVVQSNLAKDADFRPVLKLCENRSGRSKS